LSVSGVASTIWPNDTGTKTTRTAGNYPPSVFSPFT
jgi:hypothetical protein